MSSMINEILGDYRIIKEIGEGAMGKVYLAQNTLLPAMQVVLKILKDSRQKERFLLEASNLSRLDHKNICQLKHFFHWQDDLIIAMQYVDGKTLADLAGEWESIDLNRIKALTLQILDGLDYAHRRGVHHRDIKPVNIMVGKEGIVKIIDFGIARNIADTRYTQTGISVGTPAYMAPEQFTVEHIEDYSRCDIYSLGVCLYEICCGRLPFEDTNPFILKDKHCLATPHPPSSINPDVYYSLEHVISRAMAKNPHDRFTSAAEMRAALAVAERGVGQLTDSVGKPGHKTAEKGTPADHKRKETSGKTDSWFHKNFVKITVWAATLILIGVSAYYIIKPASKRGETVGDPSPEQDSTALTTIETADVGSSDSLSGGDSQAVADSSDSGIAGAVSLRIRPAGARIYDEQGQRFDGEIAREYNPGTYLFTIYHRDYPRREVRISVGDEAVDTTINLRTGTASIARGFLAVSVIAGRRTVLDRKIILNEFKLNHMTKDKSLSLLPGDYKTKIDLAPTMRIDSVKVGRVRSTNIPLVVRVEPQKKTNVYFYVTDTKSP